MFISEKSSIQISQIKQVRVNCKIHFVNLEHVHISPIPWLLWQICSIMRFVGCKLCISKLFSCIHIESTCTSTKPITLRSKSSAITCLQRMFYLHLNHNWWLPCSKGHCPWHCCWCCPASCCTYCTWSTTRATSDLRLNPFQSITIHSNQTKSLLPSFSSAAYTDLLQTGHLGSSTGLKGILDLKYFLENIFD